MNIRYWEMRRGALLKKMRGVGPFIKGSMVQIERQCGNANCRCAKGPGHLSYYLTYKEKAKTRTMYIPVGMEDDVREWVEEHRRLRAMMTKMDEIQKKIMRRYVTEKRSKAKKKS